jgi:hypothetical protein
MARLRCPESLVPCGLSARVFAPTDSAQAADAKVPMLQARGESAFCTPELDEDTHEDRGLRSHTAASVHWLFNYHVRHQLPEIQ